MKQTCSGVIDLLIWIRGWVGQYAIVFNAGKLPKALVRSANSAVAHRVLKILFETFYLTPKLALLYCLSVTGIADQNLSHMTLQ
jgi:hypothetical protein